MDDEPKIEIRYNKHHRRKNNFIVAGMYQMYLHGNNGVGCSLEDVAKVYKRTRQTVYDMFRTRGYPLRAKKKYPEVVVDGIKFTPSHRGRYWRSTSRSRHLFLHTFVWEKKYGPVPKGYGIHHKNLDKNDNRIGNLEILPIPEICRRFSNPHGLNQYSKKDT